MHIVFDFGKNHRHVYKRHTHLGWNTQLPFHSRGHCTDVHKLVHRFVFGFGYEITSPLLPVIRAQQAKRFRPPAPAWEDCGLVRSHVPVQVRWLGRSHCTAQFPFLHPVVGAVCVQVCVGIMLVCLTATASSSRLWVREHERTRVLRGVGTVDGFFCHFKNLLTSLCIPYRMLNDSQARFEVRARDHHKDQHKSAANPARTRDGVPYAGKTHRTQPTHGTVSM